MALDLILLSASLGTFFAVWFYLAADSRKDVARKLFGGCLFEDGLEVLKEVRSDIGIAKGFAVVAMALWIAYFALK